MQTAEKDSDLKLATENIKKLGADDIILASYLGSGSSLIGGILIELGLDYIEGYQEKISKNKNQTEVVLPLWRKHWTQLDTKYENNKPRELRLFKTHFYPVSYKKAKPTTAVLLIRDARDAVISYYNWRKGFSDETGTLSEFLRTDGFYGKKPFDDWTSYIEEWLNWGNADRHRLHLIKYEDLKFNPQQTIKKLLKFLKVRRSNTEIERAIENSRFSKIKKEEVKALQNTNQPRIFRKGLVGEWRHTLSTADLALIKPQTAKMLKKYQYTAAEQKKFPAVKHWFIGCDASTDTYLQDVLKRGEKAVLIPLGQKYNKTDNPNLSVIKGAFLPKYSDLICGNIYIAADNEEIVRSIENIAKINGYKLQYI